ncbi:HAD family hydrolase [Jannaschia sp. Os4]|uniref:HAD family hydrolase n=1 Tax=Jannaschia sp. Os4 TaxID=2807617 RepID=UPI0031B61BC2
MTIREIGFDADDTLWHTERLFRLTQERFADLLAEHVEAGHLMERLLAAERRNLGAYGFGVKGFVLSMIETAIEATDGRVPAPVIAELLAAGREMLAHPIELKPHAGEVVERLARDHRLVLITKGDLLDQERKLAQSGLGEAFDAVEIVSDKVASVYARAFSEPERAVMVGDSMKSDIVPAIAAGAWALHVPSDIVWEVERADDPRSERFRRVAHLGEVPEAVEGLR